MGRGIPKEAEWGIGIAFIVGMVITLILAIQTFEGPTSVILLVVGGVFLLVGLFFLTGTQRGADDMGVEGAGMGGSSQQQSVVIGAGGAEPYRVTQGGPSYMPAAAQPGQKVLVVCSGCKMRVADSFKHCPHCGTAL
jgi:hypothetical protein